MKIDDDIFLNVPNLIHFLLGGSIPVYSVTKNLYDNATAEEKRLIDYEGLLLGFRSSGGIVFRSPKSKWYRKTQKHYKKDEILNCLNLENQQVRPTLSVRQRKLSNVCIWWRICDVNRYGSEIISGILNNSFVSYGRCLLNR